MTFTVFYFSGTGNTQWAVNEFSNRIEQRNHDCTVYAVENKIEDLQSIIDEADYIGFAFPVYGADMPIIMREFFEKSIGKLAIDHKKYFIMTTVGYVDAMGPFVVKKALTKYHFDMAGYISLRVCNNISTPKLKSKPISREALKARLVKGLKSIDKLIEKLISEQKYITNIGPYLVPGIIIRKATAKGKKNHAEYLSVDTAKCSACMRCVNNCPTKSIVYSDGGFTFLSTCTICMRCYNFCPVNAVLYDGKFADPCVYIRYKGVQDRLKG